MNLISNIENIKNFYVTSKFLCVIQMIFCVNLVYELSLFELNFQALNFQQEKLNLRKMKKNNSFQEAKFARNRV